MTLGSGTRSVTLGPLLPSPPLPDGGSSSVRLYLLTVYLV